MTDRRDAETKAEVRLRGVLEPDGEALARVVRRALEPTETERLDPADRTHGPGQTERAGSTQRARRARRLTGGWRGRWSRFRARRVLLPLAGGLAGGAAVLAFLLASPDGGRDASRPEPAESSASTATDPSASVTHRDGVLIVRRLDGGTSLLDARAGRSAESRGMTIILKGERP